MAGGKGMGFTGVDDPYEAPLKPELTLDCSTKSTQELVVELLLSRKAGNSVGVTINKARGLSRPRTVGRERPRALSFLFQVHFLNQLSIVRERPESDLFSPGIDIRFVLNRLRSHLSIHLPELRSIDLFLVFADENAIR